jgi:exodeoxyribonuclease V beta subunit
MTSHKAKGLEADVVFVYGGFNGVNSDKIRTYVDGDRRLAIAGRPRDGAVTEAIKRERDAEDQRLYYVALTRARKRLYLPYSGLTAEVKEGSDGAVQEDLWRLTGGYRHVNQRLRALLAASHRRFQTIDVPVESGAVSPASPTAALAAWRPAPALLAEVTGDPTLAALRVRRAGTTHTSYSRIKAAQGGYHPPSQLSDEVVDPLPALTEDDLPGGARSGIFLHALLEQLPLPAAIADPTLAAWSARDDVRAIIEGALRRHGREARLYDAAARLAHAALTAPLPVVGGQLDGVGRAAYVARELEFLFPFPDSAGGADRGFVKGFVDVIFAHEGRTYFGDWKTDRLPVWDDATVDAHIDANYGLQERLYSLALARMLGIDDAAAHEARFGGTLYVFVRGLPGAAAVRSRRPSFADLERWRAELAETLATEDRA